MMREESAGHRASTDKNVMPLLEQRSYFLGADFRIGFQALPLTGCDC